MVFQGERLIEIQIHEIDPGLLLIGLAACLGKQFGGYVTAQDFCVAFQEIVE